MLIRIFRTNKPELLLFLSLFAGLMWFIPFTHPAGSSPSLYAAPLQKVFSWIYGYAWLTNLCFFILIIVESVWLNTIFERHKLQSKSNYLIAFLFVLLSAAIPALPFYLHIIVANLFLIMMVNHVFGLLHHQNVKTAVFHCGLITSIASFFFFPSIIMSVFCLFAMMILLKPSLRNVLIFMSGLALPYIYYLAAVFWQGRLGMIPDKISSLHFAFALGDFQWGISETALIGIIIMLMFLSIPYVIHLINSNTVAARRMYSLMVLYFIITISTVFFSGNSSLTLFFLFIPLSLFFSNVFAEYKKQWIYETLAYLFIIAIIFHQFIFCGLLNQSFANFTP